MKNKYIKHSPIKHAKKVNRTGLDHCFATSKSDNSPGDIKSIKCSAILLTLSPGTLLCLCWEKKWWCYAQKKDKSAVLVSNFMALQRRQSMYMSTHLLCKHPNALLAAGFREAFQKDIEDINLAQFVFERIFFDSPKTKESLQMTKLVKMVTLHFCPSAFKESFRKKWFCGSQLAMRIFMGECPDSPSCPTP